MKEFRAIMIHGVGEQDPNFADEARRELRAACVKRGISPFLISVHWAPLADRLERQFLKDIEAKGSKGSPLQKLVIGTLADALFYQSSPVLKIRIFEQLDNAAARFGGKPFTVFAHSLGGLIFTDWLRQRPNVQGVRLVTFGCNIGLFTLGSRFTAVHQLSKAGSWINYFAERDMLGYPLAVDPSLAHVEDHKVNLGGLFRGWSGLSHLMYWGDSKLWAKTIPKRLLS
jgi:hypothetical protein